jgi:ABC-type antimicrobial peptide transport system permease subunit
VALIGMVLRQALALAAIGIAAGVAAAIGLGRLAGSLLYQVSPTDGVSLAAAAVVMLLVAIAAAVIPARRAARVDPLSALRSL